MKLGETHNYITILISFLAPQRSLCTFGLHIFGPSSCVSLRLRFVCVYAWQRDWRPDERERNRAQRYILWWKRHGQRSFPRPHRTKQNLKKKKKQREKDQIENEGICVAHAPSHANGQNLAWFSLTISNSMRAKISIDSNWCESKNKK